MHWGHIGSFTEKTVEENEKASYICNNECTWTRISTCSMLYKWEKFLMSSSKHKSKNIVSQSLGQQPQLLHLLLTWCIVGTVASRVLAAPAYNPHPQLATLRKQTKNTPHITNTSRSEWCPDLTRNHTNILNTLIAGALNVADSVVSCAALFETVLHHLV